MTPCSSQLSFGFLGRREINGRFDGGKISSDGGAMLLAAVDQRYGVTEAFAARLRDRRDPAKVRQPLLDMVRQRVYAIACGYEDCNDADTLGGDPIFKTALGRAPETDPDLASQPTLSRFENGIGPTNLYRASEMFIDLFVASHSNPPDRIILDFDATDDPTHGQQQLSLFHAHYETHCYLPLLVFAAADDGPHQLLAAVLRPGNAHAARGTVAILKRLVARLRAAWPNTQILLRGDSGFALPEVYEWCEQQPRVDYLLGLARNSRVEALTVPALFRARCQHLLTGAKARCFDEFEYAAHTWSRRRRVIVKAEVTAEGDNPRYVVTSLRPGEDPAAEDHPWHSASAEELYTLYAQRGDAENRIKELKGDLAADRTSCHRFAANQFRLLLHAVALLLVCLLRQLLCGTALATAQAGTLRVKLLKVGVRVKQTARRIWLHFATAYPLQHLWDLILRRLQPTSA